MGLSISLDTGVTALRAAQIAMDVESHNVANANTEGYTRQEVLLKAVPPAQGKFSGGVPLQQIGLGVDVSQIRRIRDLLLDTQYRDVNGPNQEYAARSAALSQMEQTLNEPSEQGLQALITKFFNGFRDLASQPESVAARSAAVEQGATLAAGFNRTATLLTEQRNDLDASLDVKVGEINADAVQIAKLNADIRRATIAGQTSNDLHDSRDLLLDKLSGLIGVTVQAGPDDSVNVFIGTRALVNNVTVDNLATQPNPLNNNLRTIVFSSDNATVTPPTGEVKGIIDARDVHVGGLLTALNGLATTLISSVNTAHQTGFGLNGVTGLNYFTGADAATIGVNAALRASPQSVATADVAGQPGNANAARAIAGVQGQLLYNGNTATIDDAYRGIVAGVGVQSQQAQGLALNEDTLTRHLDAARKQVSGVSLDEEMTNMLNSQHAFQAAARVITTADSMLDTLINRMLR